jgi:murein DD-endopeptidase MepM/ murein hydrolase activator NlpD
VWPRQGGSFSDINSTFGPRKKTGTTTRYDWHRGVDIGGTLNDNVLAVFGGTFEKIQTFADGGTTVVLRHTFSPAVSHLSSTLNYFFTYYMHLNSVEASLVAANAAGTHPTITAGQHIAYLGHSGTASYDHVHIELRIGTMCSLEYQIANPTSSCSVGFGFDPHFHAMLMFVPETPLTNAISLTTTPTSSVDGVVTFTSDRDQPLLNRLEFTVVQISTSTVVLSHVLDYDLRTGFDATSTTALDTPDKTKPYIDPVAFGTGGLFTTKLIIPKTYVGSYYGSGYTSTVNAQDIWENSVSTSW